MRILKLKHRQFSNIRLSDNLKTQVVLLECQVYGKVTMQYWHLAVTDASLAQILIEVGSCDIVPDTGRTKGWWQSLGADGVFDIVSLPAVSGLKGEQLASFTEGKISISGDTWQEILNNMPEGFVENLKSNK